MKQGMAKNVVSGTKVEPKPLGVSPKGVAQLGIHHVETKPTYLYEGRGLKAPMVGQTNHKSGSQGKH